MATKITRITEDLKWTSLRDSFYIGFRKKENTLIDELSEAVEDGTLDAMVAKCADMLHDGDQYAVYLAMSKNLSSQLITIKKEEVSLHRNVELKRYEILRAYVDRRMDELKVSKNHAERNIPASVGSKSYWEWELEEIIALSKDLSNYDLIASVYNNMASKASKYPQIVAGIRDWGIKMNKIADIFSAAKLVRKAAQNVDANLINKIAKGDVASLTPEEIRQITEALSILKK